MTQLLEDLLVLDELDLTDALLCGEPGCSEVATHRAFYVCCKEGTLICAKHRRVVQAWINLHSKADSTCSIHGTAGTLKEMLKIEPL